MKALNKQKKSAPKDALFLPHLKEEVVSPDGFEPSTY